MHDYVQWNGSSWLLHIDDCVNPNTFAGLVGKVRKNYLRKEEGREGGEKKRPQRARRTRGLNPGLEPGTCRVLGEGPLLHARGAV